MLKFALYLSFFASTTLVYAAGGVGRFERFEVKTGETAVDFEVLRPVQGGEVNTPAQVRALIESDLGRTSPSERAFFRRVYARNSEAVATLQLDIGPADGLGVARWIDLEVNGMSPEQVARFFGVIKYDLEFYISNADLWRYSDNAVRIVVNGSSRNGRDHMIRPTEAANQFEIMNRILTARLRDVSAKDTVEKTGGRASPDVMF